jgi:hypothetical protein
MNDTPATAGLSDPIVILRRPLGRCLPIDLLGVHTASGHKKHLDLAAGSNGVDAAAN